MTLHLCPEGRPVGANLTRQCVATDKVRGYLVQPFARHIQLCQRDGHVLFCHCRHQGLLAFCGYVSVPRDTSTSGFDTEIRSLASPLCCGVAVTGLREGLKGSSVVHGFDPRQTIILPFATSDLCQPSARRRFQHCDSSRKVAW